MSVGWKPAPSIEEFNRKFQEDLKRERRSRGAKHAAATRKALSGWRCHNCGVLMHLKDRDLEDCSCSCFGTVHHACLLEIEGKNTP